MPEHAALNTKEITTLYEIRTILQQVCKSHQSLTLQFAGIEEKFSSLVIEVDSECQFILLDEMLPNTGHRIMLDSEKFKVFTNYHGVPIIFSSRLLATGKESKTGLLFYQIEFPRRLTYLQRRQAFRLPIQSLGLTSWLIAPDQTRIAARLIDISVLGFRALIEHTYSFLINENDTLMCELDLGNEQTLNIPVMIRRILLETSSERYMEVGFKFLDLNPLYQRQITQFITTYQREQQRRERRLQ